MEHIETFRNLAELTITIVGFSALISLLQKRKNITHKDRVNQIRFSAMLEQAIVALIFSYLPIILINYLEFDLTFRLCSGLFGIAGILYFRVAMKRNKKITGKVNVVKNVTFIYWILAILINLASFMNAFGFLGQDLESNYLSILFTVILFSVSLFIRLIYSALKYNETE